MKIYSTILDHKIEAANVLVELSIREYLDVAKTILDKNDFQRRKVIKSSVSRQLKEDLKTGCTIPPIILAVENELLPKSFDYKKTIEETVFLKNKVEEAFKTKSLIIVDGLQRTNVLLDLQKELYRLNGEVEDFFNSKIRAEIYIGVDKLGILYRMITLNSGQQTMSLRHLVEILYSDYKDEQIGNNITLYTQKQNVIIPQTTEDFNFKDIIDGFNAYITEEEQPLTKVSVLDNIQSIKKLADIRKKQKDAFTFFVLSYQKMLNKMNTLANGWFYEDDQLGSDFQLLNKPFGKTALEIFRKSQVIFGFGVALRNAVNFSGKTIEEIGFEMEKIEVKDTPELTFHLLLKRLDEIRNNSKISIGAAQRVFFKYFFSALLLPNPYNRKIYLNLDNAIDEGMFQTSRELNFPKEKSIKTFA